MINPFKCCGCGACELVCGKGAISLSPDKQGFLSPRIDEALCINCDLCSKVCPEQNQPKLKDDVALYAVKAEKRKRMQSQSGGAFALLAEDFLNDGGAVYGAAFDGDLSVRYLRITEKEELFQLKNSKYVQADNRTSYLRVFEDLEKGIPVLYSGTPCYVAGLYQYLSLKKCSTEQLCTVDLICHGVPSPALYREYLCLEADKAGKAPYGFVFRDKKWSLNEKYSKILWDKENATLVNGYLRLFSSRLAHRGACLSCQYACRDRIGDITLGDFWGIEKLAFSFDDYRGVSLVIANSEKGRQRVCRILPHTQSMSFTKDEAITEQPAMQKASGEPKDYRAFWDFYYTNGLEKTLLTYCDYSSACHIPLKKEHIKTLDKHFLYAHMRGKLKTFIPAFLKKWVGK